MKKNHLLTALLLLCTSILVEKSAAVTAYPYPVTITQRDGSKLTVIMQGDERVKWAKTTDGYSLIYNRQGVYEYAKLDASGDMVPSGVKARDISDRTQPDFSFLASVEKGLVFSPSQVFILKQVWRSLKSGGPERVFPTTGNRKLICLLIGFTDRPFTKTQTDFQNLFNQAGYSVGGGTGSVRDFYSESSYNQLSLSVDVAGPFMADNAKAYYGANTLYGTDVRARELVTEAVQKADPTVDFSVYDNDGDGSVDGVHVIFAGYGEEAGGGADCIWSHAWDIPPVTCDGKTVGKYSCSPELRDNYSTGLTRIGVICHEFGHVLGAPDFYDTNYAVGGQFDGTGQWDLQGNGSWNNSGATPAQPNPYTKIYVYGWATATTLSSQATLILQDAARYSNSFYRLNTTTEGEYFLMENRQKVGFDAFVPGHGLMIYHVHKDIESFYSTNAINATYPQRMYPVCASATSEPNSTPSSYGNINEDGCPFPGSDNRTSFTDRTLPSQKSWAGVLTGKPITGITEDNMAKTITINFMGSADPNDPDDFFGTAAGRYQIYLNWLQNSLNNPVMIATGSTTVFGKPVNGTVYAPGNEIPGGGRVIFNGSLSSYNHTGLTTGTTYQYKAWSVLDGNVYSTGVITDATTSGVKEQDSLALVALFNQCNGPGWTKKANWLTGSVDTWEGVLVAYGRVMELNLGDNMTSVGLTGTIPAELSNLTEIRKLKLFNNQLSGPVPASWSALVKLRLLYLYRNQLTGNLPESWSTLVNLEGLVLSDNQFSGNLPVSWSALVKLKELDVARNQLDGTLPASWSAMRQLWYLLLSDNQFTGTLPKDWSSFVNLRWLLFGSNQLSGTLPDSWSSFIELQHFSLHENQFTGSLPESWSSMVNLEELFVHDNRLSGTLPESWSSMTGLYAFYLGKNSFTGTLPGSWSSMQNLTWLFLSGCQLTGTLPVSWSSLTSLAQFGCADNQFTGNLPESWSSLVYLRSLNLDNNQFNGSLPDSWSSLVNLTVLTAQGNQLTGTLPDSWSALVHLKTCFLGSNQLSGSLPDSWSGWLNLDYLVLDNNQLSGTLPDSWSSLVNLSQLSLSRNQLTGILPLSWSALANISSIYLDHNRLTGAFPISWLSLAKLQLLFLNDNQISELPKISGLTNLTLLQVHNNLLDFGDLEPNIGAVASFNYTPQAAVGEADTLYFVAGQEVRVSVSVGGTSNLYAWFRDGIEIPFSSGPEYVIPIALPGDAAVYTCRITNTLVPYLELRSNPVTLVLLPPGAVSDSLVLVTLYKHNNGANWTQRGNWLTGKINTWEGVTIEGGRLVALNLGNEAASVGLTGQVPLGFSALTEIRTINLANNQITGLPDLSALTHLTLFQVENNLLDFGDIEPNIDVAGSFVYSPQAPVGSPETQQKNVGEEFTTSVTVQGQHNIYQWYKNGQLITGATSSIYRIAELVSKDWGIFTCAISNSVATGLTLSSQPITLQLPGLLLSKPLAEGWTWFSLNVINQDMSVDKVFSSLESSNGDYIKNQTVSATYYEGTGWFGELTRISPLEMYKIKLGKAGTLLIEGLPVDPLYSPVTIVTGWNWIGYTPQTGKTVTRALSTMLPVANDYIKNQTKSSTYYDEAGWFGELNNLDPLDGYMLKTSHNGTLTYQNLFIRFTDERDGKTYSSVVIGTQTWMAENLAYLPSVSPPLEESETQAYYYVHGYEGFSVSTAKTTDNYLTYGALYNWVAAQTACPAGWHLPSDEEWTTLVNYLGTPAGGKLKETGNSHWLSPNTGATNESDFTAIPGSYRGTYGAFDPLGYEAYFWSGTAMWLPWAKRLMVSWNSDEVDRYGGNVKSGFSVRCLK